MLTECAATVALCSFNLPKPDGTALPPYFSIITIEYTPLLQ